MSGLLFLSVFFSYLCYISVDPMKSCLMLVLSLLVLSPFISFGVEIWYSYFVCMVFLSGIFVILVYFTSMSKYSFYFFGMSLFIFFGLCFSPLLNVGGGISLFSLYFFDYFFLFMWLIFSFFLFMNFSSYFLNFSGALRMV